MDILLPPYFSPDDESVEVVDRTSTVFRPEFAAGVVQRQEQSAPILRVTQKYSGMSASDRGALLAFVRQTRGRVNGIWLTPLDYSLRGSFPASELLTNNTFANGTTGWTVSLGTLTVQDRVARLSASSGGSQPQFYQNLALTQYVPYALRSFIYDGQGTSGLSAGPLVQGSAVSGNDYSVLRGLRTAVVVSDDGSAHFQYPAVIVPTSGYSAGSSIFISYTSLSRCALVDNGPNLLTYSDDGTQASAWTTVNLNSPTYGATDAAGGATATRIFESSSTSTHYITHSNITVASAAADYSFSCVFKSGTRSWAYLELIEATGSTIAICYFNISSGAIGASSVGTNWSNLRAVVRDIGGGFFCATITARKTNAATVISVVIGIASADNTASFTGSAGANAFNFWRATLSQSSVPTRLSQTTSAASSGSSQTGSALYIKGLPVSTNGLLLPGDLVQVGNELKMITASLNSDAAGLSYLQFEPPLFRSPADNDPVIIQNPMGKFILADNSKIANRLGRYADIDMVFEELYE